MAENRSPHQPQAGERETMTQTASPLSLKTKVGLIRAHGREVLDTGLDTLREARGVLARSREELVRTLAGGAERIAQKLWRIATPTRKEEAELHKAEIKAKKRSRRGPQARKAQGADGQAQHSDEGAVTTH